MFKPCLLSDAPVIKTEHYQVSDKANIVLAMQGGWFALSGLIQSVIDQELFIISVKSQFQATNDRETILHHTSSINTESAIKTDDDGVSQQIQVKKGLSGALVEKADLKSIVKLKPFRTFREIEQPEGEFLFRMRNDGGVECALFEADGGSWKNTARKSIADFFSSAGVAIIA